MKKILLIIVMVFMLTGIFGLYNKDLKVSASTGLDEVVMNEENMENEDDESCEATGGSVPVIKKDDDTGNTPLGNDEEETVDTMGGNVPIIRKDDDTGNTPLGNDEEETVDTMGGNVPVIKKDDDTGNTPLGNGDGESESQ